MNQREHLSSYLRREQGVALFEFVIVFPVLMLLIAVIFDLVAMFSYRTQVGEIARVAVRSSSVLREDLNQTALDCGDYSDSVTDILNANLDSNRILPQISFYQDRNTGVEFIRLRLQSEYPCFFCNRFLRQMQAQGAYTYDATFVYPIEMPGRCGNCNTFPDLCPT